MDLNIKLELQDFDQSTLLEMPDFIKLEINRQDSLLAMNDISKWNLINFDIISNEQQLPLGAVKNGTCPECSKTFKDNSTALRHFKNKHCKQIHCPYCAKKLRIFGRPDIMRNHLLRCTEFEKLDKATFSALIYQEFEESARLEGNRIYYMLYGDKIRRRMNK